MSDKPKTSLGVIGWWELRRIPYNFIIGIIAFISLLLFFLFIHLAQGLKPGEDAVEPIALLMAPIVINVAYTFGWITELFLNFVWRRRSNLIGPVLFQLGLSFSIVVVMLPSAVWFIIWVIHSIN